MTGQGNKIDLPGNFLGIEWVANSKAKSKAPFSVACSIAASTSEFLTRYFAPSTTPTAINRAIVTRLQALIPESNEHQKCMKSKLRTNLPP